MARRAAWWRARKREAEAAEQRQRVANAETYSTLSEQLPGLFGTEPGIAGIEVTTARAMRLAAVYACVRLIAGAVAQMPLRIMRETPRGPVPARKMVERMLNRTPNPIYTGAMLTEWIVCRVLLEGNAYVYIGRTGGQPSELVPLANVSPQRRNGRLVYRLATPEGGAAELDQADVLHFVNAGFDGVTAPSVIQRGAANAVGIQLAMEEYSARFFTRGALQRYAIIREGNWTDEQREGVKAQWRKHYAQGVDQMSEPMVFDRSVSIQELGINARDSQILESREYQVTDIARAFGVPSFLLNQEQKTTSWGAGVAEIGQSFLRYTLMPHIARLEAEWERKLYPTTGETIRYDTAALVRPTARQRYDGYRVALGGGGSPGFLSVNEVRAMEGLVQIDDERYDLPSGGGGQPVRPERQPPEPDAEDETEGTDDNAEDS